MTDYIKLCVDIPKDVYDNMVIKNEYTERDVIAIHNALMDAARIRWHLLDHERIFENIIVRYPPEEICIYPEYKGKAYFSIQYEEKGEHFVGFGTSNPEVLSRYLIDYFITPMMIKADTIRDCKTCGNSKDGKCAGTEECHDCMWESKYIKKQTNTSQQKYEDIVKAFQVGLAFGFGTKHDEMDRMINEIKNATSDCKNVPWYLEVLRQGVNLSEDNIKKEEE